MEDLLAKSVSSGIKPPHVVIKSMLERLDSDANVGPARNRIHLGSQMNPSRFVSSPVDETQHGCLSFLLLEPMFRQKRPLATSSLEAH